MTTRLARIKHIAIAMGVTVLAVPTVAYAQSIPNAKLDESLRESVERGCAGTQSVIVTAKPGYRQSLRDSLAAHGDVVKGEFPSLEAIAADVHCEDLATLAGFDSTTSVSLNGPIAGQDLPGTTTTVATARAVLVAAKTTMLDAQKSLRIAERAAALADAQVVAAKWALILANRLAGLANTTAVAAAQARLAQVNAADDAAQAALEAARTTRPRRRREH